MESLQLSIDWLVTQDIFYSTSFILCYVFSLTRVESRIEIALRVV